MGLATKDGRSYGDKEGARITHLDSETSSVDVVSEEEVVVFLERATNLEYLHEIVLCFISGDSLGTRKVMGARIGHVYHHKLTVICQG